MVWYGIFRFGQFIGWCTTIASLIPRVFSLHYAIPFLFWLLISNLLTSSIRGFNSKCGRVSTLEIQTKVSTVSSMFFFYVLLITITECNKKNAPEAKSRAAILVACAYI